MKKIFLMIVALLMAAGGFAFAVQEETLVPNNVGKKSVELVSIDDSSARLRELERRMDNLERDIRSQNDSMRGLERDLNDVRRRRL